MRKNVAAGNTCPRYLLQFKRIPIRLKASLVWIHPAGVTFHSVGAIKNAVRAYRTRTHAVFFAAKFCA